MRANGKHTFIPRLAHGRHAAAARHFSHAQNPFAGIWAHGQHITAGTAFAGALRLTDWPGDGAAPWLGAMGGRPAITLRTHCLGKQQRTVSAAIAGSGIGGAGLSASSGGEADQYQCCKDFLHFNDLPTKLTARIREQGGAANA